MRTRIFSSFADLPEDFRENFDILWELPEEHRSALIPRISELVKARTTVESDELLDGIVSEIGGDAPMLLRALDLLRFISRAWHPQRDKPENFLQDIAELKLIPPEKAEVGKEFLLAFFNELQKDNLRRLHKMYANMLLPNLSSFGAVVDLRAVFDGMYQSGKVEDYTPNCIGFVPVIVINITRDSGEPKTFNFQCEPDDIKRLISQLQATLKELENAQSSLPEGAK